MKKNDIHVKEVSFPHIRAKVQFFDLAKLQGIEVKGAGYTCIMSKDEFANITVGVFIEKIEETIKDVEKMPYVFHEIVHALQYICEGLGIDMAAEKESVAYMAHYLLQELLASPN